MKALCLILSVCSAGLVACNTDNPLRERPPAACFRPSDVARWGEFEQTQFWVETERGDVFAGRLRSACPSVGWVNQIAIQPEAGRDVCSGDRARIVAPDPTSRTEVCLVDNFHPVSPADAAVLTKKRAD